ncbi:MAG: hypothetical protein ACK595_02650 [Planctomycetota bacterium]
MSRFADIDLYKGIVLASLLLLPIGGWAVYDRAQQIEACNAAIADATRAGGVLEEIGSLQRKVEIVVQNKRGISDAVEKPTTYFEGQIKAAGGGNLKVSDFTLVGPKVEGGTMPGTKQSISDYVLDVNWPRNDFAVPMDFVYAVLFNCESGAGLDPNKSQSVWKLRNIELANATDERLLTTYATPPAELQDKWKIRSMAFVRREPAAKGK